MALLSISLTDTDGKNQPLSTLKREMDEFVADLQTKMGHDAITRKPAAGTWQPVAATSGTDTACTNGTAYIGRIFLPWPSLITGIRYLIGSIGGTDKVIATLYNEAGTLLRASAAAGITVGTAANSQDLVFSLDGSLAAATTYEANAGFYWIGLTFNGTTAKFRSVPAYCHAGSGLLAGSVAQTFGTIGTSITPVTDFTADKAPVASLY